MSKCYRKQFRQHSLQIILEPKERWLNAKWQIWQLVHLKVTVGSLGIVSLFISQKFTKTFFYPEFIILSPQENMLTLSRVYITFNNLVLHWQMCSFYMHEKQQKQQPSCLISETFQHEILNEYSKYREGKLKKD